MFTGIIDEVGILEGVDRKGSLRRFKIKSARLISKIKKGDSVSINGICLTVTGKNKTSFIIEVVPETLRETTARFFRPGNGVNLETSLRLGDRLGGHLVFGHVDGVGRIESIRRHGQSQTWRIKTPKRLAESLVRKASIAIEGVSMTVQKAGRRYFEVAVIPFTLRKTNFRNKRAGDFVNLEIDMISRYVARFCPCEAKK